MTVQIQIQNREGENMNNLYNYSLDDG